MSAKASAPGLQITLKDGQWIDAVVPDYTVIVTPSELLGYMTNGKIPATTHRVVNSPEGDYSARYAFPFFALAHLDTLLFVLDTCSDGRQTEGIPCGKLLFERLAANGVTGKM